jgi:isoleucyl-tRNA synthetase
MFRPVDSRQSFPKLEEEVLEFWNTHGIFGKSVDQRPEDKLYVFFEGPPTANGQPGLHHVLARAFKDLFPRYKTMRGYRVPRKGGWDTHGLPVELEVERELGLKSKPEIEEFGVEEFNKRCRESVFRYVREWERLTERIGFWVDMSEPYVTYHNEYIESVWWFIRQLWENDLLYQDYRSTPHCPRCGTSLSDAEVALGYKEDTVDPSVFPKFRLTAESAAKLREAAQLPAGDEPISLVAWTTTPWTLPGNTALAVSPGAQYGIYEHDGELLVVAKELGEKVLGDGTQPVRFGTGDVLVGLKYEPLYDPTSWGTPSMTFDREQNARLVPAAISDIVAAYIILGGDFVSLEDGTGIVHIAPAFGGEDFQLGKEHGLLFLQPVDLRGEMPAGSPWPGVFVKKADPKITKDLTDRGLMLKSATIKHTYPFCWRCDTPLLYYAKPTWYIRTTSVKDKLISGNDQINWYPEHIRSGRFGDWLRNNIDWGISRERYWGTPLPIWRCSACDALECVGSVQMLRERAVDRVAAEALDDLHRPYIDRIELQCESCGGSMKRTPELMDVWLDSGAMPFAQWHYPFENQEKFERMYPADFICEAVDQTRGWFYTLHAEAVLLNATNSEVFRQPYSFANVICTGHIQDDKGRKMSKSVGNVVDPWTVIDQSGADALRWYLYTATRPGDARRFSPQLVQESLRRFFLTFWNTYSFFVTYANLDDFDPTKHGPGTATELDRWVLSELNALVQRVTDGLENYDPTATGRAIQDFVDDLSNWYVRRSRRRFWKGEVDEDKTAAFQTLYTCLVTVTKLIAPYAPFVAESVYQNLVRTVDKSAPESVHLAEWPEADASAIDQSLMDDTRLVMRISSLARAARQKAQMKVRQPLASATAFVHNAEQKVSLERLAEQVIEESNIKELRVKAITEEFKEAWERPTDLLRVAGEGHVVADDEAGYAVAIDTRITPELADEGLARELVHRIQGLRKAAGLEIEDRIVVLYSGSDRARDVLSRHARSVKDETLANALIEGAPTDGATSESAKVEGGEVTLAVAKA